MNKLVKVHGIVVSLLAIVQVLEVVIVVDNKFLLQSRQLPYYCK